MLRPFLLTLCTCLGALPAFAGQTALDATPEAVFVDQLREQVIGLDTPLALTVPADPARCGDVAPQTRALLVGADKWTWDERYHLSGTENDTELMLTSLAAKGVVPKNMERLAGDTATVKGYTEAANRLLAATQCGDSVILHFSGWLMDASFFAPSASEAGPFVLTSEDISSLQDWASMGLGQKPANEVVKKGPWLLLNQSDPPRADVISSDAVSDLVTRLRNRGADVAVILDTSIAEEMRLEDRQARVDPNGLWRTRLDPAGVAPGQELLLATGAGAFTVFYGTAAGEITLEMKLPADDPNSQRYGAFSFSMAQALLTNERTSPAALGRALTQVDLGERQRGWTYLVSTTAPDRDLIAEGRPAENPADRVIKILSPEETRAASPLDQADIVLRGQVIAPADTVIVLVNQKQVQSKTDGTFEAPITLQAGVNTINIAAMTRDNKPVLRTIELYYEGDMDALLGSGKRYALILSNQDYADGSGLSDLKTPHGDAEALAKMLRDNFGFVTEAEVDGEKVPLILRDATRLEIETALFNLSQVAGEKDTVLIFYAGHGLYEAATQKASWLAADAKLGKPFSYLPASAITDALLRINANNILVISDSCYSGALLRGGAEPAEEVKGDRLLALQRLSDRRSRIVVSSGGNEPVLDGGGGEHSVFAQALLTGLSEMEEDAFSVRELFDRYLLPMTVGRSAQEPQYRPIESSGHEGGDVVLARAGD